jgi:hypothetical protein
MYFSPEQEEVVEAEKEGKEVEETSKMTSPKVENAPSGPLLPCKVKPQVSVHFVSSLFKIEYFCLIMIK